MFARVWPLGLGFGLPVASAALTQLDINVASSIDAAAGGAYAPAAPVIVNGAGTQFGGTTVVINPTSMGIAAGFLTVTSPTLFIGATTFDPAATLAVNSAATFGAAVVFSAGFASNAASLFTSTVGFNGVATFTAGPIFNGSATFNSPAIFTNGASFNTGGAVGFAVPTTFASTVALQAVLTNTSEIVSSGPGRVVPRPRFDYTNADQSIGTASGTVAVNGADSVHIQNGSMTVDHTCTVLNANARPGTRMRFYSWDSVHTLTLQTESAVIIAKVKSGTVHVDGAKDPPPAGFWSWIELEFAAVNNWLICGGEHA